MARLHTAIRTTRRLGVALVAALGVLGVSALAVFAAQGKPDFSISVSPASQTVTLPASGTAPATFTVTVARQNGLTGAIATSVSGLPAGVTAAWNGTTGATGSIGATQTSSVLTVTVSSAAKAGSYPFVITGVNGSLSHSTAATLSLQPASDQSFTLTAQPASQTVLQGDSAAYDVTLTRTNGFTGAVTLSTSGLSSDVTGAWDRTTIPAGATTARLTVSATAKAATGTSTIAVTGAGTSSATGATLKAFSALSLTVQAGQQFRVGGAFPTANLAPGAAKLPLDVQVTNPNNFPITIQRIDVTVEEQTSRAGCSGSANYVTAAATQPFVVPASTTNAKLSSLGIPRSTWPTLAMLNRTGVNQDACKGATLTLDYNGTATK